MKHEENSKKKKKKTPAVKKIILTGYNIWPLTLR